MTSVPTLATLSRSGTALFVLVLALAGALRLPALASTPPGLYPDEAMNGNNALEALRTGEFRVYYPENNGREGLMIAIQALSLRIFGVREPWVLRVPSALIGVATVAGVFVLGRELVSLTVGCLAAFFLATSTWHIHFSRMGFRAILAPLLATWAIALLLIALRRAQAARPWLAVAMVGGAVCGLGFYSYLSYRVMPLLLLLLVPFCRRDASGWRVAAVFLVMTGVVGLPLGAYFVSHPEELFRRTSEVSVFAGERPLTAFADNFGRTVMSLFTEGDTNWRHNFSGRPQLFWPVAAACALGAVILTTQVVRDAHPRVAVLLLGWVVLAICPVAFSREGVPHALRSIGLLPPVVVIAAVGGQAVLARLVPRVGVRASALAVVLCGAGLTYEAYHTYFRLYAPRPEVEAAFTAPYVEVGRAMERLSADTRKIVVVDAAGVDVRGVRMPAQTVMFITDTFDPEMAARKNVVYIDSDDLGSIEPGVEFHLPELATP